MSTAPTAKHLPHAGRPWPLIAAVATILAVLIGGWIFVRAAVVQQSVSMDVVIVPGGTKTLTEAAQLYDSLSRGQVVATAASIYSEPRWTAKWPGVNVTAGSVTPSSVVQIQAVGPVAVPVKTALEQTVSDATPVVNEILKPYQAVVLTQDQVTVTPIGLTKPIQYFLVLLASIVAGYIASFVVRVIGSRPETPST